LSHQEIEAQLLSLHVHRELMTGIAAGVREQIANLVQTVLKAAQKKEAWACKVILDMAGITQALQALLCAEESSAPEVELLSAMEHSLVGNLLTLIRGDSGELANLDFAGK